MIEMRNNMKCLRCEGNMNFIGNHDIQLGRQGWFLGDLPNLIAGALEVDIYACDKCDKLEFYITDEYVSDYDIPQKECPICKTTHDFDYPKCPFCGHKYEDLY